MLVIFSLTFTKGSSFSVAWSILFPSHIHLLEVLFFIVSLSFYSQSNGMTPEPSNPMFNDVVDFIGK